ncbi:glutathione S-transferase 1-like [Battus philenor]|uniref:glutathione S-transferase 1-like n=1 Tax=Battus philenor TaxID=42288 RepID=UPI0035CF6B1A
MAIDLYYTPGSAPCRLVLLVAAALNISLNPNLVNLKAGEQMQPHFLKMNPQHTVPTIVDDGFTLWESRAISRYLVNKYGADSSLYPHEPEARALVDQRLDFDVGTLFPRFAQYFFPQIFAGAPADEALLGKVHEALGFLDAFLEGYKYAAGEQLTLADLSLVSTVSTIDVVGIKLDKYPNIVRWYELVKTTAPKYEEANGIGLMEFKAMVDQMMPRTEL